MTKVTTGKNAELDQLLAGLGTVQSAVPDGLMARILADAAAVQDDAQSAHARPRSAASVAQRSPWARITAAVGGGMVLAGLGSAAVVGVALGFVQPALLETLTSSVWGQGLDISVDLLPADGDVLAEG